MRTKNHDLNYQNSNLKGWYSQSKFVFALFMLRKPVPAKAGIKSGVFLGSGVIASWSWFRGRSGKSELSWAK